MDTTETAYDEELAAVRRQLTAMDTLLLDILSDRLALTRRERVLAGALGENGQVQEQRIHASLLRAAASDPHHGHLLYAVMATLMEQNARPRSLS